jgi:hypothetical protein
VLGSMLAAIRTEQFSVAGIISANQSTVRPAQETG